MVTAYYTVFSIGMPKGVEPGMLTCLEVVWFKFRYVLAEGLAGYLWLTKR